MKEPKNINYCATVVEIKNIIPLGNCDNVVATSIMGNQVIIGKDVEIGDIGLFFPVETKLSEIYLKCNNLYNKSDLNQDNDKRGYFELNGRIKCVKFRGNKSEGLFMPITSLELRGYVALTSKLLNELSIGSSFDELEGVEICCKYIPKTKNTGIQTPGKRGKGRLAKESKLIEGQFRFHDDTSQLYRNLHMIHPDDLISITYKMHGTSFISSNILCKKSLKWYEKILKRLGVNIVDTFYDNIYSSRKVIKNEDLHPDAVHYYSEDIWGIANQEIKEFLTKGMTIYGEIVGFLPSGGYIQNPFDFACEPGEHKVYIYRITYTNPDGKVYEFSMRQVQQWCVDKGLNVVPLIYYGTASNFVGCQFKAQEDIETWRNIFLQTIKDKYNEKDCYICKNKVPEEGVVVRLEKNELQAYKAKSTRFLEKETKDLDKGEVDIETEN